LIQASAHDHSNLSPNLFSGEIAMRAQVKAHGMHHPSSRWSRGVPHEAHRLGIIAVAMNLNRGNMGPKRRRSGPASHRSLGVKRFSLRL
jgi:hypothetical protein